jgi:hypothetical protein
MAGDKRMTRSALRDGSDQRSISKESGPLADNFSVIK